MKIWKTKAILNSAYLLTLVLSMQISQQKVIKLKLELKAHKEPQWRWVEGNHSIWWPFENQIKLNKNYNWCNLCRNSVKDFFL